MGSAWGEKVPRHGHDRGQSHGTPRALGWTMQQTSMRSALVSFLVANLIAIAIAGGMSSSLIGLSMLSPDETHEVAPSAVD